MVNHDCPGCGVPEGFEHRLACNYLKLNGVLELVDIPKRKTLRFVGLPTENKMGVVALSRFRIEHIRDAISRIYVQDDMPLHPQAKEHYPFQINIPICWANENFREIINLEFMTKDARDKAFDEVVALLNAE